MSTGKYRDDSVVMVMKKIMSNEKRKLYFRDNECFNQLHIKRDTISAILKKILNDEGLYDFDVNPNYGF